MLRNISSISKSEHYEEGIFYIFYVEKDGTGRIADCPFTDKQKQFEDEFKANLDKANETTDKLIEEVSKLFEEKKSLTKAEREEVLAKLTAISRNIGSNNDFLYQQFNEQMNKTTLEAKGEIEAFMQNKLNSIAQEALMNSHNPVSLMEAGCNAENESVDNM